MTDQTIVRGQGVAVAHSSPLYLRRPAAAEYVQSRWGVPCAARTLAKLAVVGGGPEFRKAGRTPLYEPSRLDDWAKAKIGPRRRTTSDTGGEA